MEHSIDVEPLLKACLDGDPLAWETLVRAYQNRVYAMCHHYLRNADDAEEVAQETFVRVYKNRDKFAGEHTGFLPWILTIGRHCCIDRLRHNKVRFPQGEIALDDDSGRQEIPDQRPSPEQRFSQDRTHALIYQALAKTDAETKDLIVLKEIQGLKIQEIAEILQLPIGTVKSKCHRAKLQLAKIIQRLDSSFGLDHTN